MSRSLIIVGASARGAAFSAIRAGFAPYAIDMFADSDLAAVCPTQKIRSYPADFLPALEAAPSAPWIYTGGLENYPRLVDQMAKVRPLWGNSGKALRRVRNPFLLAERLSAAGVLVPELARQLAHGDQIDGDWLQKPLRSSAGLRIRLLRPELRCAKKQSYYYQRFAQGRPCGAVFNSQQGECQLLGATNQLLLGNSFPSMPFGYRGSYGPRRMSLKEQVQLQLAGDTLVREFGLRGLFNVDYILGKHSSVCILEVNPRYSASIEVLENALTFQAMELHSAEFSSSLPRDIQPKIRKLPQRYCGKIVVYARSPVVVSPTLTRLDKTWNKHPHSPGLADIPSVGDRIAAGSPIATVLCQSSRLDELESKLAKRARQVEKAMSTA